MDVTAPPTPVEELSADAVAKVSLAYHFEGTTDYQHVIFVHAAESRRKKRPWASDDELFLEDDGNVDMDNGVIMKLAPPLFARKISVLCNNTTAASIDFCNKVWNTCKDVKIQNSPFSAVASEKNSSVSIPFSKLTDQWNSSTKSYKAMGGSANIESIFFNRASVSFKNTVDLSPPQGICLEKIGNGSFLSTEPHPDESNCAFLSNQAGLIWFASIPAQESGGTLDLN